eukprot:TRINITY_DN1152_c0_g4_i3.p1 TRINITY_DN1152_c0_g4~~TRINITY_DN1152_c0_g4_i3.p1  ORF type:complete len:185 (-),score=44.89 TRINITY_DN1152_c0_g4_i3:137-691(-)
MSYDDFNKTDVIRVQEDVEKEEKTLYDYEYLESVLKSLDDEKEKLYEDEEAIFDRFVYTKYKNKMDEINPSIMNFVKTYMEKHFKTLDLNSAGRVYIIRAIKFLLDDDEIVDFDEQMDPAYEAMLEQKPSFIEELSSFINKQINSLMGYKTIEELMSKGSEPEIKPEDKEMQQVYEFEKKKKKR